MLELLTNSRKSTSYPDTGPGSIYLQAGSPDYGYFGTVSNSGMGVIDGLNRLVIDKVSSFNSSKNIEWYKFFFKGKTLFFPSDYLATISYSNLQSKNMTYDAVLSPPVVPELLPGTTTPMYKSNEILEGTDGSYYRVRLIKVNGSSYYQTNYNWDKVEEGYHLFVLPFSTNRLEGQIIKLNRMFSQGTYATQDMYGTSSVQSLVTSLNNNDSPLSSASINVDLFWVPILEYISEEERAKLLLPARINKLDTDIEQNVQYIDVSQNDPVFEAYGLTVTDKLSAIEPNVETYQVPMEAVALSIKDVIEVENISASFIDYYPPLGIEAISGTLLPAATVGREGSSLYNIDAISAEKLIPSGKQTH